MKLIVPGINVKVFGKAIHCLAKIGDEVYLESEGEGLTLRTVNISRSAFSMFYFGPTFFSGIEKGSDGTEERCKVMVRSLLLAFRSLSCLEKTVASCTLELNSSESKLLLCFHCRHSVRKSFSLGMLDCDNLRAVYDINKCQNKWIIDSKVMQDANGNFLANQEEVTMFVESGSFKIKNYNDNVDEKKQIHTELSMQPGEFESYEITEDASITFCLKEFRSLLLFAEYLNLPITAHFSQGGLPLVLSIAQGDFLSSRYVLATLAEDGSSQPAAGTPGARRTAAATSAPARTSATSASAPVPARTSAMLHSTQRDSSGLGTQVCTPDLSTIPPPPSLQTNFEHSLNINNLDNEDCFEASPPAKKKNFLFRRCFDATWNPNKIPGTEKVLAPDSDEEK